MWEEILPDVSLPSIFGCQVNGLIFGGHSAAEPPVPIPNTEVKRCCADGTAGETLWESRSPPDSPEDPREIGGPFYDPSFRDRAPGSTFGRSPTVAYH